MGETDGDGKRRRRWAWYAVGGVLLVSVLGVVGLAIAAGVVSVTAKEDVGAVLTEYLRRLEAGDADRAHALYSSFARQRVPLGSVEALTVGNNRVLVSGFSSLDIDAMTVAFSMSVNSASPAGLLGRVHGRTHYHGGFDGTVDALVQREGGEWRLVSVYQQVSPDQMAAYSAAAAPAVPSGATSSSDGEGEGSGPAGARAE